MRRLRPVGPRRGRGEGVARVSRESVGEGRTSLEIACANQRAYYEFVARPPIADVRFDDEIAWYASRHSFFNSVTRLRTAPERADRLITQAIAFFRSRGIDRFAWRISSDDRPRDLGERLVGHGFRGVRVGPMMTLDLACLDTIEAAGSIDVEVVMDARLARDWAEAAVRSFGLGEGTIDRLRPSHP
jgi:hypothetical protein